jgi:hypothetical protein
MTPRFQPATLRLPVSPAHIGYLAGLLDGEGYIGHHGDGGWVVQVAMTDLAPINWLAQIGGTMRAEPQKPPRRTLYRWRVIRSRDVRDLLIAVRPFLQVKHARADEALAEIATRLTEAA